MKRKLIVCVLVLTFVLFGAVLPFNQDVFAEGQAYKEYYVSNANSYSVSGASKTDSKLSSSLLALTGSGDAQIAGADQNDVYVYIQLVEGGSFDNVKALVSKVDNTAEDAGLMAAWVSVGNLTAIAEVNEVKSVFEVIAPVVNSGTYLSEGDALHRADEVRTAHGADGTGVKIGVISDGVDSMSSAVSSGDLPSNVTVLSNTVGGDEGTAMLEIVHDLAPGAQLYFHDMGNNAVAFCEAIQDLADAGCDVICDDIGWFDQPFFEDGYIANYLTNLLATTDIVYSTSAGNQADEHYQGQYASYNSTNWHAFPVNGSQTQLLTIDVEAGGMVRCILQWNDAFGSANNDYDLVGYEYKNGSWGTEATWGSTSTQNGDDDPFEFAVYQNTGSTTQTVGIGINKYSATGNEILELFLLCAGAQVTNSGFLSPTDAIFGHGAVPAVITCGAVHPSNPDVIAYYSSQGPVTMRSTTRQKPDVCGLAGVEISGAGGFGSYNPNNSKYYFYGTSAASPHIAAVAGLLRSKYPAMDNDAIRALIVDNCDDLGAAGYDNVFGYGRSDAVESVLGVDGKDVNYDGYVDTLDVTTVGQNFNCELGDAGFNAAHDFNADNIINIYDLVAVAREVVMTY